MNRVDAFPSKQLSPLLKSLTKRSDCHWDNALQRLYYQQKMELNYPFKEIPCFVLDFVFIGANPVLNYFLLLNLYQQILAKSTQVKTPITIGFMCKDEVDYWGYHSLKSDLVWAKINQHFNQLTSTSKLYTEKTINDFENFLNNSSLVEIYHIPCDNFQPIFYDTQADNTKKIIQLGAKQVSKQEHWFQKNTLPVLLKQEHRLAQKYQADFLMKFNSLSKLLPHYKTLIYPKEFQIPEREENESVGMHFLIAENIYLTSQPFDWIATTSLIDSENLEDYRNCEYHYIITEHSMLEYSFGSAKHSCYDFLGLEEQCIMDIISCLEYSFDNDLQFILKERTDVIFK